MRSQNDRLMTALEHGAHVTPLYAWHQLGIYRLAARVRGCREAGADIVGEWVEMRNQFGEPCRVKKYFLAVSAA